jgi:hypothetical protein
MPAHAMAAVRRLGVRFLSVGIFAALWSGPSAVASATLCVLLACGCVAGALTRRESLRYDQFNRWHEAVLLVTLACLIFLMR